MRGEDLLGDAKDIKAHRITPACAGKTRSARRAFRRRRGSPPHARGRLPSITAASASDRITPACAGKTLLYYFGFELIGDHPRMRGEDYRLLPRAVRAARITPACAGKTDATNVLPGPDGDHPRMRGEDATKPLLYLAISGSPPHARGRRKKSA